ncbi:MAG: hypothetical protein H0U92_06085 [Actinobacteria bacterium]|nr:hypothetical protein [Actinomycetota bacterium]
MSTSEPNSADTPSDDVDDTEPQNNPAGEIVTPQNPDKPGEDLPLPDEANAPPEAHPA